MLGEGVVCWCFGKWVCCLQVWVVEGVGVVYIGRQREWGKERQAFESR